MQPVGPPQAYQTFSIRTPWQTHWRRAGCAEAGCLAYHNGWVTSVDVSSDLGKRQAEYIIRDSSREWKLERSGHVFLFRYGPGQKCFSEHYLRNARPARLLVHGGDWRGNPSGMRREHKWIEDWIEDFSEQADSLRMAQQRG